MNGNRIEPYELSDDERRAWVTEDKKYAMRLALAVQVHQHSLTADEFEGIIERIWLLGFKSGRNQGLTDARAVIESTEP